MLEDRFTGNQIRQTFIEFFQEKGHTFVPSSSLVPGGDQTLLFTNSGMVQFKDVFLGTDRRPYSRAANSQKCMRVAGKHNDLDDVGRDETHHTFFEMLGNWSFGDYYKKEAIAWAWELLTEVWGLPKEHLWASCFEDELGEIPRDDEAADFWRATPGFVPEQVLFFGRKDNFWEMAETGPCGPNSEIHFDRGPQYCDRQEVPDHVCQVNGDCARFWELWNLVFIQYNRTDPKTLHPLPKKHVDTGMGFERLVSLLQDVDSNYLTDLLAPLMNRVQALTGHDEEQRLAHPVPYRVIVDHGRAAAFLIADGVVPGNTGRNYVCRMIIRRAARFGLDIGLTEPFLAPIAEEVIAHYGEAYPELRQNQEAILDTLTREERRFQRTLETGLAYLEQTLVEVTEQGLDQIPGKRAFNLYASYGLPIEITRDFARERGLEVDVAGYRQAEEDHRMDSGAGKALGELGGEEAPLFQELAGDLQEAGQLAAEGVAYDPYTSLEIEAPILALVREGESVGQAGEGEQVDILLPRTCFYIEAGGQVADRGTLVSAHEPRWEILVEGVRQPASGVIVHSGRVVKGQPRVGDQAVLAVDAQRRNDIMRNHTATHLLHAELRAVLGSHARQQGSLVAPDRLRFDFTHPEAVTREQLQLIEAGVNRAILDNHAVRIAFMPRQQALDAGAMALFGEKYGEVVRTISIGTPETFSFELCGGTHLGATSDIGLFLITSEEGVGAGVRRIEAVTGRAAYQLVRERFLVLDETARLFSAAPGQVPDKTRQLLDELDQANKQSAELRRELVTTAFERLLAAVPRVAGLPVLASTLPGADAEMLRQMADRFRQAHPTGVAVLASVQDGRPVLVGSVSEDLVGRGLHAGELVKTVAQVVGGGGGGRPTLAQAGGKDASRLPQALEQVPAWVEANLQQ